MAKGPKQKIALKLEQVFGVPFAELIGKNFKKGDSRYEVQKRLLEMIVERKLTAKATEIFTRKEGDKTIKITEGKWDPEKWEYDNFGAVSCLSNPAFRPSTLYHAIKNCISTGELNQFDFLTSNKGRKSESNRRKPTLNIEFKCTSCGTRHKSNKITSSQEINLRVYACPKCGYFGKCIAKIIEGGKLYYKAVVKVNGVRQEVRVVSEDDLTPIQDTPGHTDNQNNLIETGKV
jgi:transcription elongation factor Elf1